jgi:ABC-type multidrug transport system ATPase subunit
VFCLGAAVIDVGDSTVLPVRTVSLRKVFQGHDGPVTAVHGLDLEIEPGEFFGLLGPNGAGKSTTIGMLTTTVVPSDGTATISGIDVQAHPSRAKRQIGVVSQANTLDRELTVWENLYYHGRYFGVPRREARRRAGDLLERFSLGARANAMVRELSGGLARRLMIARALAHRPDVLFLDEPTSSLDPQTRHNLWDLLGDLHREGLTIVLTTHFMEEADLLCERIAILDHGRLLALGAPSTLKRRYGSDTVITVTAEGDLRELARTAMSLDGVRTVEANGSSIRVFAHRPPGVLAAVVQAAAEAGIQVEDASSQPSSLEAVFLSLTGREYRE